MQNALVKLLLITHTFVFFRFKDVSMRYRDELPLVLKKVNFKVKSKEKIGIVGRTGSGEFDRYNKLDSVLCIFS